jgi:hypothetical protein
LRITEINLRTSVNDEINQGNLIGLTSNYQTSDGMVHAAADVWFVADKVTAGFVDAETQVHQVDLAIAALVEPGAGNFESITTISSTSVEFREVEKTTEVTPNEQLSNLRTRVSSLTQALGAFEKIGIENNANSELSFYKTDRDSQATSTSMTAVTSMFEVMQKFGKDGGLAQKTEIATSLTVNASGLSSGLTANGYLAIEPK